LEDKLGFFPAHPVQDCEYLLGRAKAEIEMADLASSEAAAARHHELASLYLARVFSDEAGESEDPWTRLEAWQERRAALQSIFGHFADEQPREPAVDLVDLLGRLDSRHHA
jgi:hypothetical protein